MGKKEEKEVVYTQDYYESHKVLIWIFIGVLFLILVLSFVTRNNGGDNPVTPDNTVITIKPDGDVVVGRGYSTYLTGIVDGNVNQVLTWKSSDESIATVNSNGVVTGVGYGKVTIIASFVDSKGNPHDTAKVVTVADGNSNVPLTDVKFPEGDLYMPVNSTYSLSMVLVPADALINDKTFTSSNIKVATVDDTGLIKSISSGHSRIIATINGNIKRSIDVYVSGEYGKSEIIVSPTSISFGSDIRKIKNGTSEQLNYSISPANSDRSKLTWESSNSSIVSVSDTGYIKANKEGKAIISVSSINGKKDSIIVEVYDEVIDVQDITFTSSSIKMDAGKTQVITPTIVPSNASNKGLSYVSMDSSIVSVTPSSDGTSATLSALKAGTTTIVVSSNNIEKRLVVIVEGNGNNSYVDEDTPNHPTTIKVRSNKNNLAKTYEDVKNLAVSGVTTVTVELQIGVGKISYCINRYGAYECTPNIDMAANGTIEIPSGGIYVIRIKKFDYSGNEIGSNSINYVNGVLNYYVNTTAKEIVPKEYTVTNAYSSEVYARDLYNQLNDSVLIKLKDATRHLKMCYTSLSSCTPNILISSDYKLTLARTGLYRILINEYDENNNQIGNTETYFSFVKSSSVPITPAPTPKPVVTATPTPRPTNVPTMTPAPTITPTPYNVDYSVYETNFSTSTVKASNLEVNSRVIIGKYLAVDVASDIEFGSVRFCYNLVSKGSNQICNLDLASSTVEYHNGQSFFHPTSENTTFFGSFTPTKKKTLWFDIDGLDYLYDNFATDKDVLFAFSIRVSDSAAIYSSPIYVRLHMIERVADESKWKATFIR